MVRAGRHGSAMGRSKLVPCVHYGDDVTGREYAVALTSYMENTLTIKCNRGYIWPLTLRRRINDLAIRNVYATLPP